MKQIIYIKNGEYNIKDINLITKGKTLKDIIEKKDEEKNIYKIKEDISLLKIINLTFKENISIIIPDNTSLLLENCIFSSGKIELIGGNIQIVYNNPHNEPQQISSLNTKELKISSNGKDKNITEISSISNIFSMKVENILDKLKVTANNIKLEKIYNPKTLKLTSPNIKLKRCEIEISSPETIVSQNLSTERTILYLKKGVSLSIDNIKLKESNILLGNNYKQEGIYSTNLTLENSTIYTREYLTITSPYINIDKYSKIIAGNDILIQNRLYPKEEKYEVELTNKELQTTKKRSKKKC